MSDQANDDNTTIAMFPGWCFETLSAAFVTSTPPMSKEQAEQFISRLRNSRLSEVDELETILGMSPSTAEIRKQHRLLVRGLDDIAVSIEQNDFYGAYRKYKVLQKKLSEI